jgi:hypothetical protein
MTAAGDDRAMGVMNALTTGEKRWGQPAAVAGCRAAAMPAPVSDTHCSWSTSGSGAPAAPIG